WRSWGSRSLKRFSPWPAARRPRAKSMASARRNSPRGASGRRYDLTRQSAASYRRHPMADPNKDLNLMVGVSAPGKGTVTARKAAGLFDMKLPVSPSAIPIDKAIQNMAKAINIAFESDFLETELESVYKAARVRKGTVEILHGDYIGLGDGVFAEVGKLAK